MANRGPFLPEIKTIIAAGINPKTGLPVKLELGDVNNVKPEIKRMIELMDRQDAINRYTWTNVPYGLTSQMIENLLYDRGSLVFFYMKEIKKFYLLPYALDGTIDMYGRYNTIHPIPFATTGENEENENTKKKSAIEEYLSTVKLECVYDILLDERKKNDIYKYCVILNDYNVSQCANVTIPRRNLQNGIIDVEAECIPLMRTALLNSTGVSGVRCEPDAQSNVIEANATTKRAAMNGERYVPIVGNLEFQELAAGNLAKAEEFLMSMQSIDNFRKGTYGLPNGGLYNKQAYVNESQVNDYNAGSSTIMEGLILRQHFCDVVNSIWGIGIDCNLSEVMQAPMQMNAAADTSMNQNGDTSGGMTNEQQSI